jgi:hypothetical protein
LRLAGFEIREEPFGFSEFPAKSGPTICGALYAAGAICSGHLAFRHGMIGLAIASFIATAVVTGFLGRYLLSGVLRFRVMQRSSANLIAQRSFNDEPKVWLVAHTDSKSQTIPMLVRVGSIAAAGVFFAIQLATLIAVWIESARLANFPMEFHALASLAGYLTAIAIVPVILCFITNESPGALDNATGVAAVLIAAGLIPRDRNVGIVLTTGEELGLAGARAFVGARTAKAIAINCDTIDNSGKFIAMLHRRGDSHATRMSEIASTLGEKVKVRPLIRGILTDGVAFGQAGWDSWTLSRGNIGTLALVHTSRDRPERIVGTGIAIAARILAATAEELS